MFGLIGIVVIFVMVFGGYLLAGGKLAIILKSLPFEMMMIGGAALGAFLISNDMGAVKQTAKDIGKVFKGPKWKPEDYRDLLCLLFSLIRIARQNPVSLEAHIEDPDNSDLFAKYPKIRDDHEAVDLIADTLRSASMNYDDPHQVEEVLEKRIEANQHHALHSSHALQNVADGLPAIGIVAAVLGVIKTMSSIDQPPEILGKMIGGALVGTFLGVFLAYCMVQPISGRLKQIEEEDGAFYMIIRDIFVAMVADHPPSICVEIGRGNIPTRMQPDFYEVEAAQKELPAA